MSRTDGLEYDYPPVLGMAGRMPQWDIAERRTINVGPNRHKVTSPPISSTTPPSSSSSNSSSLTLRTLFWEDLEPWMDGEYVKQVCALMGWEPQSIQVPPPNGPNANNPGHCLLTFPSQAHAASVIAQLNSTVTPLIMPNSAKPFQINWASGVQLPPATPSPFSPNAGQSQTHAQYPTEYSIFVGDLAPETSNSDLVAVFRNPVLGLRNDREPKFIRPFLSCKSAKIMLDPVTGVSRGYGFVRFTDEADQQRALVEMHGLYCLSRPMRISPATAKFKPPITDAVPAQPFSSPFQVAPPSSATTTLALPGGGYTNATSINGPNQPKSVSSPIAASNHLPVVSNITTSSTSNSLDSNSNRSSSAHSFASNASLSSTATVFSSTGSDADVRHLAQQVASQQYNGTISSEESPLYSVTHGQNKHPYVPSTDLSSTARYMLSEESWKHHAQARAILGNMIGSNGEQLTGTDPYNTTVFVGGLSPLINEDTLGTFFAPFGDVHYVKVPVGKNCGFVQFVRKADAEKAIEKMQGFPIGGNRIRLSWGRSQYKAAQAAAQAAQAAALQLQGTYGNSTPSVTGSGASVVPPSPAHPLLQSQTSNAPSQVSVQNRQSTNPGPLTGVDLNTLTQGQAIQLLQKLMNGGYMDVPVVAEEGQHDMQIDVGSHRFGNSTDHHQQTPFGASSSNAKHATTQQQHIKQGGVATVHRHLHSLPGAGLYAEEKLRAAHLASREDVIGSNSQARYHSNPTHNQHQLGGMFDHSLFGFNPTAVSGGAGAGDRRPSVVGGLSFSPFSPDSNSVSTPSNGDGTPTSPQRRESVVSAPSLTLSGMTNDQNTSGNSRLSSTMARPTSNLTRYGDVNGPSRGVIPSPVPTPTNSDGTGRNSVNGVEQHYQQRHHHYPNDSINVMHDVNGTLASLDIDSSPNPPTVASPTNLSFNSLRPIPQFGVSPWSMNIDPHALKSPAAGSESESGGTTDSIQYLSSKDDREGLRATSPM